MPRFAANLSMLYNEHPFVDRFAAAAADGFKAVEFLFPYEFDASELAARLKDNGLQQVLFNAPPGDWSAGERGLACLPGREAAFREGFTRALGYADALQCPRIHVMAGLAPSAADPAAYKPAYKPAHNPDLQAAMRATYLKNLAWAAEAAAAGGREVLIEPINPRDFPGYFLNRQDAAHAIVQEIGAPNLKVQFDLYHCQIVEGDVASKLRQYLPSGRVGHIQIAGVPERHEPHVGELNYNYLLGVIDAVSQECGWDGWVGCEYRPRLGSTPGATTSGLSWLRR